MGYTTYLLPFRSCGLALGRVMLSLWLTAACVLALPHTSHAQTFNSLYSFTGGSDGSHPIAGMIQATDGNRYGTASGGGANDWGTVFKITPQGTLTTLHSFSNSSDGGNPVAGLLQASDGNLYGTTSSGGAYTWGTIFQITTSGTLTTLYSFTGGIDGGYPSGLIQASDGYLYGTTYSGGASDDGTIFRQDLLNVSPILSRLSPKSATARGAALTLTVNGTGFVSAAKVNWNGTALKTTFVSSTKVAASIPGADIATAGTASITVNNPGTAASNALTFKINNPKPVLSSVSPNSAEHGRSSLTITLTGSNFLSGSRVKWILGGKTTVLSSSFVSSTTLTATVTRALLATAGTANLKVSNLAPGGGTSAAKRFTIR